ncbi:unnamed protein product, partial [Rotaria sordida]
KSRGFGYVEFNESKAVDEVLLQKPHIINSRTIEVERPVPKEQIQQQFRSNSTSSGPGMSSFNRNNCSNYATANSGPPQARSQGSNKRTTDNSTSSALSQHDLPQPLQTVPVVLDESNTTLDIEADSSSASKKFKSNDHETSTDAEIQPFSKNDIGLFVGKDHISATEIHDVLTNPWIPSDNYNFPQVLIHKKMRSICQHSWLSRYSWLSYSLVSRGVFCRYCVLFKRK